MKTLLTQEAIDALNKRELIKHLIENCGYGNNGRTELEAMNELDLRIIASEHRQNNLRFTK